MSFRARLFAGFLIAVMIPLGLFAVGVRQTMSRRLVEQYRAGTAALAASAAGELQRQGQEIAGRLSAIAGRLSEDNRFRLGLLDSTAPDRRYLLDYAGAAMRATGLHLLQIQDADGRILSSGQFRNDYDRLDPGLPRSLARSSGPAVVEARTAEAPFLALARVDSARVAGRSLYLVGGIQLDRDILAGLTRDSVLTVSLIAPGHVISPDPRLQAALDSSARPGTIPGDRIASRFALPYLSQPAPASVSDSALLLVTQSLGPVAALRRQTDLWFAAAVGLAALLGLLVAGWLSGRVSAPLRELAARTARLDLEQLDQDFTLDRADEIGALSRVLGDMAQRLRGDMIRLREVERRATVGDLARQVNHDIKNGLIPIRNVLRHLEQVAREHPETLAAVLQERQETLHASVAYLETLARNYARLTPAASGVACDLNPLAAQIARDAARPGIQFDLRLSERPAVVAADSVVARRVAENLIGNAVDSLDGRGGTVGVFTEHVHGADGGPLVRLTVADSGRGMTREELNRAFDDFYTTKETGTGLGLSIVRRLVLDLHGALRVETEPGQGSRFIVELPSATTL